MSDTAIDNEEVFTGTVTAAATEAQEDLSERRSDVLDFEVQTPTGTRIPLVSVNVGESIAYIKQVLTDLQETAHFTNYQLSVLDDESGAALNDFVEIGGSGITRDCVVAMVLDTYDVKKARLHLKRVRDIILVPPVNKVGGSDSPALERAGLSSPMQHVHHSKKAQKKNKSKGKPTSSHTISNSGTATEEEKGGPQHGANDDELAERAQTRNLLPSVESIITGSNFSLGSFFKEALFRTGSSTVPLPGSLASGSSASKDRTPAESIKSIALSGWNPPPPERKMQGDLLYIEAVCEEVVLHITAVAQGFYVNKSNRHHFDPTPAAAPHFSHELLDTLLSTSPSFATAWVTSLANAAGHGSHGTRPGSSIGALDPYATLFAQGRSELASLQPAWNAPPAGDLCNINPQHARPPSHTFDISRAQEDLMDGFGVEEKGAQREWNDEIQAIRSLPANDVGERIMKNRLVYKVVTEFTDACKALVRAISEGQITPLNVSDSETNFVYVYNGIFMSRATDNKDTYKLCRGDEASRKAAAHDMYNQRIFQSIDNGGIHSVLCCLVDYKGERYMGQTVIPGILSNAQNTARLMYGVLEPGKRLTVKTSVHETMKKLYAQFYIKEKNIPAVPTLPSDGTDPEPVAEPEPAVTPSAMSVLEKLDAEQVAPIRVDDKDELMPLDSLTIPHIGPIEGKLLEGSDGRNYALEVLRLTPRDSNYLKAPQGTGKISDQMLEHVDADATTAYILRHELINNFVENQVHTRRNALIQEAYLKHQQEHASIAAAKVAAPTTDTEAGETTATDEDSEDANEFKITQELVDQCNAVDKASIELDVDPNCFFELGRVEDETSEASKKSSEGTARMLATYLWDQVLPMFTRQVRVGEIVPLDGEQMIQTLHKYGINVRYIGRLADLAYEQETEDAMNNFQGKQRIQMMPLFWLEFLEIEMVARAVKHIVGNLLRTHQSAARAPAATIATLLNYVFGTVDVAADLLLQGNTAIVAGTHGQQQQQNTAGSKSKGKKKGNKGPVTTGAKDISTSDLSFLEPPNVAASRIESLQSLLDVLLSKFCYEPALLAVSKRTPIPSAADGGVAAADSSKREFDLSACSSLLGVRINKLTLLRRICHQLGLRVVTREYDFSTANPFHVSDIVTMTPKVKGCEPFNLLDISTELLDRAKEALQEKNIPGAFELAQESSAITQQIVGPLHRHSLRALEVVVAALVGAGDVGSTIALLVKSLVIAVQLNNLDCVETLTYHHQLAVYFTEAKNYVSATQHCLSALYLAYLLGGDSHPEYCAILVQLSSICAAIEETEMAIQLLTVCKQRQTDIYKLCIACEALGELFMRKGMLDEALNEQRQCHKIITDLAGEDTAKAKATKERLEKYLRAVTQRNVIQAKERQAKEAQQREEEWLGPTAKKFGGMKLGSATVGNAGAGSKKAPGKSR